MKLITFINEHYRPLVVEHLAPSTQVGYNSSLNKYVIPRFGEYEMEDITPEELEAWLADFEKPGAADKAYKTLRQVIRKAIDYDKFDGKDPTTCHIKVPKKKGYQPQLLDGAQLAQVLAGFHGHYLEATVICSATLGLRRGEAFALKWEDINLNNGEVRINKSYQNVQGKNMYLPTKTVKSTRTCYLPEEVLPRMRAIGKGKHGRISIVESPHSMAKDYKDWCYRNSLPYCTFTNLRHT